MKDYAVEIAMEIKSNAENGGRSQPNLIDALNASADYGFDKKSQIKHMKTSKLSFLPIAYPEIHQSPAASKLADSTNS